MTPIFCINLLRAEERKKEIISQWVDRFGLNIQFVEAVDRRDITVPKNCKISTGEVACILSHNLVYQKILEQNYYKALILEDDAIPLFNDINVLKTTIEHQDIEFPSSDVLLLQPTVWKDHKKSSKLETKKYTSLIRGNPFGTYGYVIKQSGINFIRPKLLEFNASADHFWDFFSDIDKLTISNKPLIGHPKTGDTYINRPRDNRRKFIQ